MVIFPYFFVCLPEGISPFTSAAAEVFSFVTSSELCRAAELQAALRPLATHEDRRFRRGVPVWVRLI